MAPMCLELLINPEHEGDEGFIGCVSIGILHQHTVGLDT